MKEIIKQYIQPQFLICLLAMAACSGYISFRLNYYGETIIKKPLPLKKSFDLISDDSLADYKILNKAKITNKDILESLGTDDYLQCLIEDTSVDNSSPVRNCSLFITYYTGNPDQVPHVPEACYTGGGNIVKNKFSMDLDVGNVNSLQVPSLVPATFLMFTSKSKEIWEVERPFPIIYFFKVNGKYKGNRTTTRLALGDLSNEYSYFSKVEIKFFNKNGYYPNKEQAIEATEKLLRTVLPVLEKEYWPDWTTATE